MIARKIAPVVFLCGWVIRNYTKKGVSKLAKVVIRSNETPEQLLRRFNKEVTKSRVLADVRRKRWHIPKSELRRIAKKKAIRRQKRVSKQGD